MTKKRILIVEDEPLESLAEHQIMRELGYEVIGIALSGENAIQRAGDERPDVVLMDMKLMGEINGDEAALKIRELYQIPVVFVTGIGDKEKSLSGNINVPKGYGYVVKPYTKDELQGAIEKALL